MKTSTPKVSYSDTLAHLQGIAGNPVLSAWLFQNSLLKVRRAASLHDCTSIGKHRSISIHSFGSMCMYLLIYTRPRSCACVCVWGGGRCE